MEIALVVLLTVAAIGGVFYPLVRREAGAPDPILTVRPDDPPPSQQEVDRYRRALRAGTLCRSCGLANPDGSRFCAECGRRLAVAGKAGAAEHARRPAGRRK